MRTENGVAKGSFVLSDLITNFKVTANAFDVKGALGYNITEIKSFKAVYIQFNAPKIMVIEDQLIIPVSVVN